MLGIVTNGITNWQYDKLEAMGINSIFPRGSVIISDEVGYEKPSPEIYLTALNYIQASPDEVIFVGDSWKNDIEGPGNIGIRSIWLNKKNEEVKWSNKLLGLVKDIFEIKTFCRSIIEDKSIGDEHSETNNCNGRRRILNGTGEFSIR
jgi:FMN phosphatase YigB (HAD superfamily)